MFNKTPLQRSQYVAKVKLAPHRDINVILQWCAQLYVVIHEIGAICFCMTKDVMKLVVDMLTPPVKAPVLIQ